MPIGSAALRRRIEAIGPKALRDEGEFKGDLDDMIDARHATRRPDPGQPVLAAGDPERASMVQRTAAAIPVPDNLLAQVTAHANYCGAPWLHRETTLER